MAKKIGTKRTSSTSAPDSRNSTEDSKTRKEEPSRKRVSMKDFAVLVALATIVASGLVTAVFGYDTLVEKCTDLDLLDILCTLVMFILFIGIITYILLRLAAHYLVYLGLGVLFAIIYPCNPTRAREALKRLFTRNKSK